MSSLESCFSQVEEIRLFPGIYDHHGGVTVEITDRMEYEIFASILRASLLHWRKQGKSGVWMKFPIELVNLVEAAVKEGFWFHHAEPTYLMLAYWIPEGVHSLPANASHRVRIGALVMNDKREVLVVQESKGRFQGIWKFPTGIVNQGEDICVAAVREVKEETAIDTEFVKVLAFRQNHRTFFEKSELCFMCMLHPLSFDIQEQESEIAAAQWMPWQEYMAKPSLQEHDFWKRIVALCLSEEDGDCSVVCNSNVPPASPLNFYA